jgi:hypothetical protein
MKRFFLSLFTILFGFFMLVTPALANEQQETTYPDDVNAQEIAEDEYTEDIDIEQMYRDMPVPEFKYMHNIDPGEYQDTMYSTWSPYPLFRLTTPLFFKSIAILNPSLSVSSLTSIIPSTFLSKTS